MAPYVQQILNFGLDCVRSSNFFGKKSLCICSLISCTWHFLVGIHINMFFTFKSIQKEIATYRTITSPTKIYVEPTINKLKVLINTTLR